MEEMKLNMLPFSEHEPLLLVITELAHYQSLQEQRSLFYSAFKDKTEELAFSIENNE
jgi:hypothetical protein